MEAGTDVVEHARFVRSITGRGGRLRERLFTSGELHRFSSPLELAMVFSLKESLAKALGSGFDKSLSWQDIDVSFTEAGPRARLTGGALKLAAGREIILSATRCEERTYTCALLSERK